MNSAGAVTSSSITDAFGYVACTQTTAPDPFGFGAQAGYYTDNETGAVLCGLRYYNPGTGQFINRDPIGYGGGANVYAFCGNNPINAVDPSGMEPAGKPTLRGGYRLPSFKQILLWLSSIGYSSMVIIGTYGGPPMSGFNSTEYGDPGEDFAEAEFIGANTAEVQFMEEKEANVTSAAPNRVSGAQLKAMRDQFENKTKPAYWKNKEANEGEKYCDEDRQKMKKGIPPMGSDGSSMHLHHKIALANHGTNDFDNLEEMTRTEHLLGENYKRNHPNL